MLHSFRAAVAEAVGMGTCTSRRCVDRQSISEAFGEASSLWQGWIYTPAVTVWVFLSQCLSPDHSCRDAVARLTAWRTAQGLHALFGRNRRLLHGARRAAGGSLPRVGSPQRPRTRTPSAAEWLWHGRRVRVVDGSTVTMPDTPENQAEYPQAKTQAAGLRFSDRAHPSGLFAVGGDRVGSGRSARTQGKADWRKQPVSHAARDALLPGDVVLADRYFSGWFDVALLVSSAASTSSSASINCAPTDFRIGQRLGKDDHLVRLAKPQRPKWMSAEKYAALPDEFDACAKCACA